MIRPGRSGDVQAFLELRWEIFPYMVSTAESMRHRWADRAVTRQERLIAAEQGGRLVGWATCGLGPTADRPGAANLMLLVCLPPSL